MLKICSGWGTNLTLNKPATTGRIMDRVEVKLDLTSDQ
jgi:hypothetical protein